MDVLVGCAGWSLPRAAQPRFPADGTHLERYAARLPAVEINSSFYRPHRRAVYARWGECVPEGFRFAVKAPKAVTHEARLVGAEALLDAFLDEIGGLGDRLGCVLVQLPPKLAHEAEVADAFFRALRERTNADVACEPRHPTWFEPAADEVLVAHRIARVAADPPKGWTETSPGGWDGLRYWRLHGSPRTYWSEYEPAYLDALAPRLREEAAAGRHVWCVFDNTASGAAAANALDLQERLAGHTDLP